MKMPRIGFRIAQISEPFDNGSKVEVTLDVVMRLGGTRVVSHITHMISTADVALLPEPGCAWRTDGWSRGEA